MDVSKETDDHAVQTPLYLLKPLRPPASQTLTLPCLFIRVLEGSLDQCESNQVVAGEIQHGEISARSALPHLLLRPPSTASQ